VGHYGAAEAIRLIVAGLVYIAAYAPDEGETLLDLNGRFPATEGVSHLQFDNGGFGWFNPEAFPKSFASDVEETQARIMAVVQKPITGQAFGSKVEKAAWKTLPSWYLVSQNDTVINPDLERWMAERIGATTREVAASHASLVSHPQEVSDLIIEAAQK